MDTIYFGFIASSMAGLATGVGAPPILFKKKFSDDTLDAMLGFAAGVMLATTVFSLLVPAVELCSPWIAMASLIIGAVLVHFIDQLVPHFHPVAGPEGPPQATDFRTRLLPSGVSLRERL